MPRPQKIRSIEGIPICEYFKPASIPYDMIEEIELNLEEFEAIRLKDIDGLEQKECAKKMNVSRQTFQRVIKNARNKLAEAIVYGKAIRIAGGNYQYTGKRCRRCGNPEIDPCKEINNSDCPRCRATHEKTNVPSTVQQELINITGKVVSLNISPGRGTDKQPTNTINLIAGWGAEGDGHAGDWDRQISIFPIEAMTLVPPDKKTEVEAGGYTENITIEGLPYEVLSIGRKLKIGKAVIEIKYVGKEEFKENGRPYIVSRQGRFGSVLVTGRATIGDTVVILE